MLASTHPPLKILKGRYLSATPSKIVFYISL